MDQADAGTPGDSGAMSDAPMSDVGLDSGTPPEASDAGAEACTFECESELGHCGDGQLDPDEECDQGIDTLDCVACHAPVCGNGVVDGDERCDLGNLNGRPEVSGTQESEDRNLAHCDPATVEALCPDPGPCNLICESPMCGDGILKQSDEECDEGADNGGDACSQQCHLRYCGDGYLSPGEECDNGDLEFPDCQDCIAIDLCPEGIDAGWCDPPPPKLDAGMERDSGGLADQ